MFNSEAKLKMNQEFKNVFMVKFRYYVEVEGFLITIISQLTIGRKSKL